jgi:ribokinase
MITVFGSINVDLVSRVERTPGAGETVLGTDYRLVPGGKGANQALAARRAGARVSLVGAIGSDATAATALAELAPAGVDLAGVATLPGATGLAIIIVNAEGDNTIVVSPGANARASASALRTASFARGDTLLLQMEVPFAENLAAARAARAAGARVMFSLAPYAPRPAEDLAAFDMVIVNEHEAADLARHFGLAGKGVDATVTALRERLGRTVIATLGPDGAIAATENGTVRVPSPVVKVVDTTGAGDTFCGVLAAMLDEGADLTAAMTRAAIAGALACTKEGAQPSFPTRAEIDAATD